MITSVQNRSVKEWKKLHRRRHREQTKQFLIEGFHLIEEAYKTRQPIETVIVEESIKVPDWVHPKDVVRVHERVFQEISQTETPQGIAAVVRMKQVELEHHRYVLLIDAIQDPGNLGTMIRTADAAGFSKIVLGRGTVDVYNDKVIRASQGSIFHIPIVERSLEEEIAQLKEKKFSIWATTLEGAKNYRDVDVEEKTAIIFGNEGRGIHLDFIKLADKLVKIPIFGRAESLNVGIAAGILMYYIRN